RRVAPPAARLVVARPAREHVVAVVVQDDVAAGVGVYVVVGAVPHQCVSQGAARDVLDRGAGRQGQGQPGVDHLGRRVAQVDADGAGGGGGEVQGVDAAAGLVDRVVAQGVVGVEAIRVVAGPARQLIVLFL